MPAYAAFVIPGARERDPESSETKHPGHRPGYVFKLDFRFRALLSGEMYRQLGETLVSSAPRKIDANIDSIYNAYLPIVGASLLAINVGGIPMFLHCVTGPPGAASGCDAEFDQCSSFSRASSLPQSVPDFGAFPGQQCAFAGMTGNRGFANQCLALA